MAIEFSVSANLMVNPLPEDWEEASDRLADLGRQDGETEAEWRALMAIFAMAIGRSNGPEIKDFLWAARSICSDVMDGHRYK